MTLTLCGQSAPNQSVFTRTRKDDTQSFSRIALFAVLLHFYRRPIKRQCHSISFAAYLVAASNLSRIYCVRASVWVCCSQAHKNAKHFIFKAVLLSANDTLWIKCKRNFRSVCEIMRCNIYVNRCWFYWEFSATVKRLGLGRAAYLLV